MHVLRGVQHLEEIQQHKQHCHHITGTGATLSLCTRGSFSISLPILGNTGMLHPILMGPIPCIQKSSRPSDPQKRLGLLGSASVQLSGPGHLVHRAEHSACLWSTSCPQEPTRVPPTWAHWVISGLGQPCMGYLPSMLAGSLTHIRSPENKTNPNKIP